MTPKQFKQLKPDEAYWMGYAAGETAGEETAIRKLWTLCREENPPYEETVWATVKKEDGNRITVAAFRDEALGKWICVNRDGMPSLEVKGTVVSWMKYEPEPLKEEIG